MMEMFDTKYKVHECSKCQGDTNYSCISCACDMCSQCTVNHVQDLKTIDHNIVLYRDKPKSNLIQGNHSKHSDMKRHYDLSEQPASCLCKEHRKHTLLYIRDKIEQGDQRKMIQTNRREFLLKRHDIMKKHYDLSEQPASCHCKEHRKHTLLYIRDETEQGYQQRMIQIIRNEFLNRHVIMTTIEEDHKTCHETFTLYQSERSKRAKRLTDRLCDGFSGFDFKHRCLKQRRNLNKYLYSTQRYEHRYEQSAINPVQFLREKSHIPIIFDRPHLTIHTNHLSINNAIRKKDVMESLTDIKMRDGKKRHVENERLLKLMSGVELHQSLLIKDVSHCEHISCVTSKRAWVSYTDSLMLINTKGDSLNHLEKLSNYGYGFHTVNNESELLFIDEGCITKLSKDMKTTFIETTDSIWRPQCVFCSPSTGDLLVGMSRYSENNETGKVTRYNHTGQLTQTVSTDDTGHELYKSPHYITENNNGDIVVSNSVLGFLSGNVVVTERRGKHRFSYTGHPTGSELSPGGICTDALSHILVCDGKSDSVQMINKDGEFLLYLLIRPPGIFYPMYLSYDTKTHRLWVGSQHNSTICVYRFITRQDAFTGFDSNIFDVGTNEILTPETEHPQERKEKLKKMEPPKKLPISPKVTGIVCCHHISCVTPDRAWVSERKHLILTNKAGETLHHLKDLCREFHSGLHTVNSDGELFYINEDYNIKKLSRDLQNTTLFLETTASRKIPQIMNWVLPTLGHDALWTRQIVKRPSSTGDQNSTWRPGCVFWSPSTGGLLVGMYKEDPDKGKIIRYNQTGQLTQTIQYNNKELELYRGPRFITENNNGDVVVSDDDAVVVTNREGRYRFSYTGHPSESGLLPQGICTDELSHIFLCDLKSQTVQMIDKDGQFLLHLMEPQAEDKPSSLSYDVHTKSLWVGTKYSNTLSIYTYNDQDSLTDERPPSPGGDVLIGAGSA